MYFHTLSVFCSATHAACVRTYGMTRLTAKLSAKGGAYKCHCMYLG